ncbi:unnamed protein product, partial [marine sediment metagenome]
TAGDETNISVILKDDQTGPLQENTYNEEQYTSNDLWGNIKIFYNTEIKD